VATGADESSVFDADEAVLDRLDRTDGGAGGDGELFLALPALPGGPNGEHPVEEHPDGGPAVAANPRHERSRLRERNAKLVQDLVWATGLGHAQVNGRLNRLVGLRRVDEATIDQLRRRAQQAERWLATL
jgi:hypothetical protein